VWGWLLFAVGVTAAGLHLWQLAWRYVRLRQAMRSWPRVPGQVLGYRTSMGSSSRRIDVQVRYRYEGQDFEVWCRSPTRSSFSRGDAQAGKQVAARFPRHSSQQVFVNPATPGEAFLVLPEPHILAMLAGGGVLLVALAFAVVSPQLFGVDQEVVTLSFMLTLGLVLSVIAVFAAIALWRSPRP
jgi:hypothetical protein